MLSSSSVDANAFWREGGTTLTGGDSVLQARPRTADPLARE
jgi:hypothetical protein